MYATLKRSEWSKWLPLSQTFAINVYVNVGRALIFHCKGLLRLWSDSCYWSAPEAVQTRRAEKDTGRATRSFTLPLMGQAPSWHGQLLLLHIGCSWFTCFGHAHSRNSRLKLLWRESSGFSWCFFWPELSCFWSRPSYLVDEAIRRPFLMTCVNLSSSSILPPRVIPKRLSQTLFWLLLLNRMCL